MSDSDEADKFDGLEDEVMVVLEISPEADQYRITVRAMDGKPLNDKEFIMHLEMWLHEITQAEISREKSGEYVH